MRTGKKACKECPFHKASPAGWLGPWKSAQEILEQAFSEGGLACHMQLDTPDPPVCLGSLICANKSAKLYRDQELRRLQARAPGDSDILTAQGFLAHHQNRVKLVGKKHEEV